MAQTNPRGRYLFYPTSWVMLGSSVFSPTGSSRGESSGLPGLTTAGTSTAIEFDGTSVMTTAFALITASELMLTGPTIFAPA